MFRKSNMLGINKIKELANKIGFTYEILRGYIKAEDYHIVLFLLIFKKLKLESSILFSESSFFDDYTQNIKSLLDSDGQVNEDDFNLIIDFYKPIIKNIPESKLTQVFDQFDLLDSVFLSENFNQIFDVVLYDLAKSLGKFTGEFVLPAEVSELMSNLVSLPFDAKIYNPFAGAASFGVFTKQKDNYYGQEISRTTWIIGKLRLLALPNSENKTLVLSDSIKEWNPFHLKYDLIIASPPFGMRLPFAITGEWGVIRNCENFIIEKGLNDLEEDGKLVVLVSDSFLFSNGSVAAVRHHLIKQDLVESVISLPSGILHNTAIKTSVLVINKNKINKGFVKIVDASLFVRNEDSQNKTLDYSNILEILKSDFIVDVLRNVTLEEIEKNGNVLDFKAYFLKEYDGVVWNSFATMLKLNKVPNNAKGKLVKFNNLNHDGVNFLLDLDKIKSVTISKRAYIIEESCLLVSKIGGILRPTYFEFKDTPILIGDNFLVFKIKTSIVHPLFLANEINKDYVSEQLYRNSTPVLLSTLKIKDFDNIKIDLPSLKEQEKQVELLNDLSKKISQLELQRAKLKEGFFKSQFDEFASLKHSLGAPRQNILSNSKTLVRFFENDDSKAFEEVDAKFRERYDIGLREVFNQIKNDINQISIILEKGEQGQVVSNYKKELIPLEDINSFVSKLSSNGFNFRIDPKLLSGKDCKEKGVELNMTLLKILFDNIFTNANKYAFDDLEESNTVMIELAIIENQLEISIKNNGKPFPNNFNKEKFISKFSTANPDMGSGLGGYDINRIASYFGNEEWVLELNSNPLYPVIFKFLFQIQTITNE